MYKIHKLKGYIVQCRKYGHYFIVPSIFPSIRVFSNESALHIRWPKYWSFNFNINPTNEYSGLISFRIYLLSLAVQRTLNSLLQHNNSKHQFFSLLYGPTLIDIDSIFKSKDVILPTKVHIVKAMLFPVVMYGCESWTIKKAEELMLWIVVLEKTLKSPLDSKEIKPANPEENQPFIFFWKDLC